VTYSVKIKHSAVKALDSIRREDRQRVVEAIDRLACAPAAGASLKGEFYGLRRIRVGDYRVIYEVQVSVLVVLVVRIAHRREAYR